MSVNDLNTIENVKPRLRSSLIPMPSDVILSFDMGWLVPHDWLHLVAGDIMNAGHTAFFRFDPFVNPILSRCTAKIYDFNVPVRILYNEREYEKFKTGGINGQYDDMVKPHFTFKNFYKFCYNILGSEYGYREGGLFGFNSLCDYLGLPVNQCYVPAEYDNTTDPPTLITPAHFLDPDDVLNEDPIYIEPFLVYGLIYREYFLWNHDETSPWVRNKYLEDFTKVPFTLLDSLVDSTDAAYDEEFVEFMSVLLTLKRKGWQHDYFTSALPNIQSGDPAMIGGTSGRLTLTDVNIDNDPHGTSSGPKGFINGTNIILENNNTGLEFKTKFADDGDNIGNLYLNDAISQLNDTAAVRWQKTGTNEFAQSAGTLLTRLRSSGTINGVMGRNLIISGDQVASSGFTINDLRLLNAIQVFKERQNYGGARLKEYLYMNYGVVLPDSRLDRPDFCGYMEFPVQISEVLQTSETTPDSVLGDQAGHGIGAGNDFTIRKYICLEPMIHMSLICLIPDTYYMQGMSPFWHKISKFDEWNPVFNHLSDQAVDRSELYFDPTSNSHSEFGYLPRYAEYKCRYNRVCGNMRKVDSGYMSWHQGRYFGTTPYLGQDFINSKPTERIFAVVDYDQESNYPPPYQSEVVSQNHTHCIGVIQNNIKLLRKIPSGSDPSLNID